MTNPWCVAALTFAVVGVGCAPPSPTARVSPEGGVGALVMAHGGSDEWNRAVSDLIEPLSARIPTALAFGMADPVTLQAAVNTLEGLGVTQIVVVRLFVSGHSFLTRTEYLFGLRSDLPGVDDPPAPVRRSADVTVSTHGLVDSPLSGAILADRVRDLSTRPDHEAVLILAHGMGRDDENNHLLRQLNSLADSVRALGSFIDVRVATLREDWEAKRDRAEVDVRSFVAKHADRGHRVIVVPFRLSGFGPYRDVLDGLEYVSNGVGLIPHPKIAEWIGKQVAAAMP